MGSPAPDAGTYLYRVTSNDTARWWQCSTCAAFGDVPDGSAPGAYDHVITTGHTVQIIRRHVTTLEGMATDAGQHPV